MNNLDHLIVEKVMEWRQITIEGHKYLVDKDGEIMNGSHPEFFPTSEGNDFFIMVDKVRKTHQLRFMLSQGYHKNTSNHCIFEDISRKFEAETEGEDKLYEAGCLAALKAVGSLNE